MRMKEIAEYEHPTDYVVIPVVMRDRIMTRLGVAEAIVALLTGGMSEFFVFPYNHPEEATTEQVVGLASAYLDSRARVKELEEKNERLELELQDALWNEPLTSGLRGEER